MNKLLLALLLVSGVAESATFATQPNTAGGKIVLTDEPCKHNNQIYEKLNRAYNYGTSGNTGEGCWIVEDETVVVIWIDTNTKSRYPIANFTLNPNWKQQNKNNGYKY